MARCGFKLRQDSVSKGFGGDSSAVGDEKNCSVGHGARAESAAKPHPTMNPQWRWLRWVQFPKKQQQKAHLPAKPTGF
jgi:hypothetical protein